MARFRLGLSDSKRTKPTLVSSDIVDDWATLITSPDRIPLRSAERSDKLLPLLAVGRDNLALTEYLIGQVLETPEARFAALREYFPKAKEEDWRVEVAGQRVQIIKKDPKHGGVLQFGTGACQRIRQSIVAMLGASPGASTAVWIMLEVIKRCFPEKLKAGGWAAKLKEMISLVRPKSCRECCPSPAGPGRNGRLY